MSKGIRLPDLAKRGQRLSKQAKGWRLVNPQQTLAYKAAVQARFRSLRGDQYLVLRIVDQSTE